MRSTRAYRFKSSTLPDGYRLVLVLYELEQYTHEEIAHELGISPNTSKTQLFKARNRLRQLLAQA